MKRAAFSSYAKMFAVVISFGLLLGCDTLTKSAAEYKAANAVTEVPEPEVNPALEPNYVRATGYAPISLQPGQNSEHKMLQAMRVSRLNAYQELAAIVHGQYVFGQTRVEEMVLQNEQFRTAVAGIIRGARVVKSYPINEDVYATVLELDINRVERAYIFSQ